mgnify:FL=1
MNVNATAIIANRKKKPKMTDPLIRIVDAWKKQGDLYAELRLQSDQLEGDEKNFLAALMNSVEKADETAKSEAKLERLARGSAEYRDYCRGVALARAATLKAKVRFDALYALLECHRTIAATDRAKINARIDHVGN